MIGYVRFAVRVTALLASGLAVLSIVSLVALTAAPAAASAELTAERRAEPRICSPRIAVPATA